jgi:putative membrane protein
VKSNITVIPYNNYNGREGAAMWYQGASCFAGGGHWFFGHGIIGFGLAFIVFFGLIVLVYRLFRSNNTELPASRDARDSILILEQRLAKGEISEEEYRRIRAILTGD